ncbi:Oxysterol-binding protein [Phakopsora pachyrhizi]|nr:Oxysterol-binding protein [Phakopsora pachyrhizi]
MEITNHRTGERCDANKVKGSVFDQKGNLAWELAGQALRWDSLHLTNCNKNISSNHHLRQYLQLWKNKEQLGNIPFNLTTFAINLSNINNKLKVWLPPTDCRLNPYQHAFERGAWEKANKLKGALEDYQRLTRWKRETGELPKHQPRWFLIKFLKK